MNLYNFIKYFLDSLDTFFIKYEINTYLPKDYLINFKFYDKFLLLKKNILFSNKIEKDLKLVIKSFLKDLTFVNTILSFMLKDVNSLKHIDFFRKEVLTDDRLKYSFYYTKLDYLIYLKKMNVIELNYLYRNFVFIEDYLNIVLFFKKDIKKFLYFDKILLCKDNFKVNCENLIKYVDCFYILYLRRNVYYESTINYYHVNLNILKLKKSLKIFDIKYVITYRHSIKSLRYSCSFFLIKRIKPNESFINDKYRSLPPSIEFFDKNEYDFFDY